MPTPPGPTLHRSRSPLADPRWQRARLDGVELPEGDGDFAAAAKTALGAPLFAMGLEVLQLNLGRRCNLACVHCHVDAGPDRKEDMSRATAERCLEVMEASGAGIVDITGGAPEMSDQFEFLVRGARAAGRHVIDRCNLSILLTRPYAHLVDFLAEHEVEVVASLPHYRKLGTDRQRGDGVFDDSIEALRRLNARGYGRDPKLRLVLVTNPVGAFLPAGQASLEAEWKRELKRAYDIDFDALFTITNMPISRYLEWLESKEQTAAYLRKLVDDHGHLARLLWLDTVIDAAIHRQWLVAMGRRSALAHLCHLICEMYLRLEVVGQAADHVFDLPLSQAVLGDALGLSTVHVNRLIGELRGEGVITWVGARITVLRWDRLAEIAEFDPTYLRLHREPT